MKDEATPEQIELARRIAAQHLDGCGGPHWANPSQDILGGRKDDIGLVQVALAAVIETQRRDAEVAERYCQGPPSGPRYIAGKYIATAIRSGKHYRKDQQ